MRQLLWSVSMFAAVALSASSQPMLQPGSLPLVFEPNRGQAPAKVKWTARAPGYRLLFSDEGATILLSDSQGDAANGSERRYSTVRMKLTGSRPWNEMEGLQPTGGKSNYLRGNDPKRWLIGIPHYQRLTASQVYEGVDLVFYSKGNELEYDFIVAPDADPKQIRLAFDGVDHMRVDGKSGDLLLTTASGTELRHGRPRVFQQVAGEQVEIAGGYEILDRRHAAFTLAAYDRKRPLVIDPTMKFNITLPGSSADRASAVAVDSLGNSYVTGRTDSTDFPLDAEFQHDQPYTDAFVMKFEPGGGLMFSTYLGGNNYEWGEGIAVDSTGIYVVGWTESSDFPTLASIFPKRGTDAFITKMNLNGNALIYSSYLGGSRFDYAAGVAVDSQHAAWVVGTTGSSDFPIAGGPSAGQQRTFGGGNEDAFLARIAPTGMSVAFSTFVGGKSDDMGFGVALDRTGSVYATGWTNAGIPITAGMKACSTTVTNAFAVRLKGPGTQTRYATCLGPALGKAVTVDSNFNAYITGSTSGNFPTTTSAFQRNKPSTATFSDGFVTKLGPAGQVVYSTYLGGSGIGSTFPRSIAVDGSGVVYVAGTTLSGAFPGWPSLPPQVSRGFVSKLNPPGDSLLYSLLAGAEVSGVSVFQRTSRVPVAYPARIYAAGFRYAATQDMFTTMWEEDRVLEQ